MSNLESSTPGEALTSPDDGRWRALAILAVAQLMLVLDVTIVNVALPSIATDLTLGRDTMTWAVAAYALTFGGLMLLGGRLADVVGARRALLAGLAVFTAASLAGGLATGGEMLVVSRAVQGVGAALMSPSALAIITRSFHGAERNRALGVWAAIGGGGAALGVLAGGVLTSTVGWRWIFLVNVPVGLAVAVGVTVLVASARETTSARRIDVTGAAAVTLATGLLVYGLVQAGDRGWTTTATLLPLGLSAVAYVMFIGIERVVAVPLVRLGVFVQRSVVSGTFVMLTATALMITFFFLTSLYLQGSRGFSALETGVLFLPVAVAITFGAHAGGRLIGRMGGRAVGFGGFGLTAVGSMLMTQVGTDANAYLSVLPGFIMAALGIGPLFVTATSIALSRVVHEDAGLASGVVNTFHELGAAIGVAVASTAAAVSIADPTATVEGFTNGYRLVAIAAGVAALAALVMLPAGRSQAAVGHGH